MKEKKEACVEVCVKVRRTIEDKNSLPSTIITQDKGAAFSNRDDR